LYIKIAMKPIKELMSKILWDPMEKKGDYEVGIIDRFTKEISFIPASSIEKTEGRFLLLRTDEGIVEIPFHRIRRVMKKGEMVWER
jgi:uncharacterized protein (UPF0248 family)